MTGSGMTPERWEMVSDLFEAALESEPHERSAFLARMCAGDDELRTEVESLIHEHDSGAEFPVRPPLDAAASVARCMAAGRRPFGPRPSRRHDRRQSATESTHALAAAVRP